MSLEENLAEKCKISSEDNESPSTTSTKSLSSGKFGRKTGKPKRERLSRLERYLQKKEQEKHVEHILVPIGSVRNDSAKSGSKSMTKWVDVASVIYQGETNHRVRKTKL